VLSGLFIVGDGSLRALSFMMPYGISIVIFERLLQRNVRIYTVLMILFFYVLAVGLYVAVYWSGFGRIVIGTFVLMPVFLANAYRDIRLRAWQIVLFAPAALYVAQGSRYGQITNSEQLFIGSAGHHLIITSDIARKIGSADYNSWASFLDQYSLLFFNWVPRAFWSGKPLGAGWLSVEDVYGRTGYSDGYTQSLGFIGEQYYLLGSGYIFGLLIVIVTLLLLRRFVVWLSDGYLTPVIIFDVNIISYLWGGAATFGSRVWFFLIPTLIFIFVTERFSSQGRYKRPSLVSCTR